MGNERRRKVSFNPEPKILLVDKDEESTDNELAHKINNVFENPNIKIELKGIESTGELIPSELCLTESEEEMNFDIKISQEAINDNIDKYLEENKIRFLDKPIDDFKRRESISKARNEVNASLIYWYKFFKDEEIIHLHKMSDFLINQMEKLQLIITTEKQIIDLREISNINLKKLRNDSRSKAKIEWHKFREIQEKKFLSTLICNAEELDKSIKIQKEKLKEIKMKVKHLRNLNSSHKAENLKFKDLITNLNETELLDEIEGLGQKLKSHKSLRDSYKCDYNVVKSEAEEQRAKGKLTQQSIESLREELDKISIILNSKNANMRQIESVKQEIKSYEIFFNLRLIHAQREKISFKIFDLQINGILNEVGEISSYTAETDITDACIYKAFFKDNLLHKSLNINPIVEKSKAEFINGSLIEELNIFRRSLAGNMEIDFTNLERPNKYITTGDLDKVVSDIMLTPLRNRRIILTKPLSMKEKMEYQFNQVDTSADHHWIDKCISSENGKIPHNENQIIFEDIYVKYKNEAIPLDLFVHSILFKLVIMNNIKKEIEYLRTFVKIDTIYTGNKIYLRIYLQSIDISLGIIYALIDENLNFYHDNNFICNLQRKMNGLISFFKTKVKLQ